MRTPVWIRTGPLPGFGFNRPHRCVADLLKSLGTAVGPDGRHGLGCVAAHEMFVCVANGCHTLMQQGKVATAFLFERIARLEANATVPMIDPYEPTPNGWQSE